jgi:hypothetical protein
MQNFSSSNKLATKVKQNKIKQQQRERERTLYFHIIHISENI